MQAPTKQTTSIIPEQPRVDFPKTLQEPPQNPIPKSPIRDILIPDNKVEIPPPSKIPRNNIPPLIQHAPTYNTKVNVHPPNKTPTPKTIAKTRSNTLRTSKSNKRQNFKYPVVQYLVEKYSTINSHVPNHVIDPNTGKVKNSGQHLLLTG